MNNIKLVVFDVYGTLLTKPSIGFQKWLLNRYWNDSEMVKGFISKEFLLKDSTDIAEAFRNIVKNVKGKNGLYVLDEISLLKRELYDSVYSVRPTEGWMDVLNELKSRGYMQGIVSNLATAYKYPLERFGLNEYFKIKIFSCDAGIAKPDSRIYKKLVKESGLKPHEILFVGERLNEDVMEPKKAGMSSLWLSESKKNGIQSIKSLDEIFNYL